MVLKSPRHAVVCCQGPDYHQSTVFSTTSMVVANSGEITPCGSWNRRMTFVCRLREGFMAVPPPGAAPG